MEIDKFLQKHGSNFSAVVSIIDVIEHSKFNGTNEEISNTMNNLASLVLSTIDDDNVGYLGWEGDGCKFLYDISDGYDEIIIKLDKIISLLTFFNRTTTVGNCLRDHKIHLRITCHCGNFTYTNGRGTLKGEALDWLSKYDRHIGIQDHIVVTDTVYQHVSARLKDRFSVSDIIGNEAIGRYHALTLI